MKKSKAMAIASFIFGLTFWIPLLNVLFGAIALYLGIKALLNIKRHPEKFGGMAYAIAGIILGTLPIVFSVAGLGLCLYGYKQICANMGLAFLA